MKKASKYLVRTLVSIPLALLCAITVSLFVIVLMSSLKTHEDILANIVAFPTSLQFDNFKQLFTKDNFSTYLLNSLVITGSVVSICMYVSALLSYGLTRFSFKGQGALRFYFLIGMMLPAQLGIVPLYILIRSLGLTNTIFSIILIGAAGLSMPVFVLSAFMRTLHPAIIESARIDGASELRIFHLITLPLMKAPIGALIPLMAIGAWNDFFMPLVFLTRDSVKTVPLGVMKYYTGQYLDLTKLHMVFTAAAVSIIPILIVYLIASKHIVSGITEGAVKA